jgi:hypothetical protein
MKCCTCREVRTGTLATMYAAIADCMEAEAAGPHLGLPQIHCPGCRLAFWAWERHDFAACVRLEEWRKQQERLDALQGIDR